MQVFYRYLKFLLRTRQERVWGGIQIIDCFCCFWKDLKFCHFRINNNDCYCLNQDYRLFTTNPQAGPHKRIQHIHQFYRFHDLDFHTRLHVHRRRPGGHSVRGVNRDQLYQEKTSLLGQTNIVENLRNAIQNSWLFSIIVLEKWSLFSYVIYFWTFV